MPDEITRLQNVIAAAIAKFKYHQNFFNSESANSATIELIKARYGEVKLLHDKIDEAFAQVEPNIDDPQEKEECTAKVYAFYDSFYDLVGKIEKGLQIVKAAETHQQPQLPKSSLRTPKIELPEFDGSIENWIHYRDMFISLVHENSNLEDIQKFHFLRTSMKIPKGTSNVVDNFTFAASNYQAAWTAVRQRFDDKRKIVRHHLKTLFEMKRIQNASAIELRKLSDTVSSALSSLAQQGFKLDESNDFGNLLIVHIVTELLDAETIKEWRKDIIDDFCSWKDLQNFLISLQRSLDDQQIPSKTPSRHQDLKTHKFKSLVTSNVRQSESTTPKCWLCSEQHRLYQCSNFLSKSVSERFAFVKEKQLCHNCLSPAHQAKDCTSKFKCHTCKKPHHTLIHFENAHASRQTQLSSTAQPFNPVNFNRQPGSEAQTLSALSSVSLVTRKQIMLSTVSVYVADNQGHLHLGRALLDSGSDTSFMTTGFAKRLGLKTSNSTMTVKGISEASVLLKHRVDTSIKSRYNDFTKHCQFFLMSNIAGNLPSKTTDYKKFNIPDNLHEQLADPQFNQSQDIDMLLDNSIFWDCLMEPTLNIPNGPTLRCTQFGWLVGGEVKNIDNKSSSFLSCFTKTERSGENILDNKLDKFFSSEDIDSSHKVLTAEEQYCENHYNTTTIRDQDGKFVVKMPMKTNSHKLGTNLNNALHQQYRLDSRRKKNEQYNELYTAYMNDLIDKGYMTEVEPPTTGQQVHYLPHHGVMKMTSSSTKLRPVFNASSVSETGITLNDILCVGPTIQPELVDVILRFRERKFIVMADITKMYLQIWVDPSQRDLLRIVWRQDPDAPMKHFHLNTVTFGTACAPYLATRTIKQIAISNESTCPEASEVMKKGFYVDDLLFSTDTQEQAQTSLHHIRNMLCQAGMVLCKIVSNDSKVIENIPLDSCQSLDETSQTLKALGIRYDAKRDIFSFQLKPLEDGPSTKASVLSNIASIFDPMGWLGPVVLTAKLIMKSLWLTPLKWTDIIPTEQQLVWDEFREQYQALNNITINRQCLIDDAGRIDIHGFCDASIVGYGAVIYARSIDKKGLCQVSLICAKSRVAPKNQKTLARLELCSAVLLSKMVHKVVSNMSVEISSVNLWSDSMIVLHWLTILPSKLQTFVGNRVAVVQELTSKHVWRHIRGENNPADVISRGLKPQELENCKLWWNGPAFLAQQEQQWPQSIMTVSSDDPEVSVEMKKVFFVTTPNDMFTYIQTRFSNNRTLFKVVVFMKRFISNSKHKRTNKTLCEIKTISSPTLDEINNARLSIINVIQSQMFPDEQKSLIKSKSLPKRSTIRSLAPFLDEKGVLRVGGRLDLCPELTYDQKHPIILPACNFTTVMVRDLHRQHLHPGPNALMSFVKQQYWPVKIKSTIRKVIYDCHTCFRAKPRESQQLMSDLPSARVTLTKAFKNTACDYAGFYLVRTGTTRNAPQAKCYIALFKCMCTGAIHLELVSDLTSKAFIAALDRFSSRRGKPVHIFSDNGTCFRGADGELRKTVASFDPLIKNYCSDQAIQWHFTTPLAPHAGGIYESGIKSMKHHLKRIMTTTYNFEQFTTILCKVEAVLNSRPLTPLSNDPSDFRVLTPGHFLVGGPLNSIPQCKFAEIPQNRLKTWDGLQQIQQQFWRAWHTDYLTQLQERPKQFQDVYQFKVGDMVLLKDCNLPPMKWLMGRIIKLFPSSRDKIVRNVRVLTQHGDKDRHVKYLCLLPIEETTG